MTKSNIPSHGKIRAKAKTTSKNHLDSYHKHTTTTE